MDLDNTFTLDPEEEHELQQVYMLLCYNDVFVLEFKNHPFLCCILL